MESFYDRANRICRERGTTVTTVMKKIGVSSGNVSKWKAGTMPNIEIAARFAAQIGVSMDYLCTGEEHVSSADQLSKSDREWLDLAHSIPEDRQELCKEFLRTHMVAPKKYADQKRA